MKRLILVIPILLLSMLAYSGVKLIKQSNVIDRQTLELSNENLTIQEKIEALAAYESLKPVALSETYYTLYDYLQLISEYNGLRLTIDIPDYKDRANIENYYSESDYPGISTLSLVVILPDLMEDYTLASVLDSFSLINHKVATEITGVRNSDDTLKITLRLYGI